MKGKILIAIELLSNRIKQDTIDEIQHDIRPEVYWEKKRQLLQDEKYLTSVISNTKFQ